MCQICDYEKSFSLDRIAELLRDAGYANSEEEIAAHLIAFLGIGR